MKVKESKEPFVLLRSKNLIQSEIESLKQEIYGLAIREREGSISDATFAKQAKEIKVRKTFLLNVLEYYDRFGYNEGLMLKALKSAYSVLKFELSSIEEGERFLLSIWGDFTAKKMIKEMKLAYCEKEKQYQLKVIEFIDEGGEIRKTDFKIASKIELVQISI